MRTPLQKIVPGFSPTVKGYPDGTWTWSSIANVLLVAEKLLGDRNCGEAADILLSVANMRRWWTRG